MMASDAEAQSVEERNELFIANMPLAYWTLGHLLERQPTLRRDFCGDTNVKTWNRLRCWRF